MSDRVTEWARTVERHAHTYDDSNLWFRLEPELRQELGNTVASVVTNVIDRDTYLQKMGRLKALEWVLAEAERLTRIEDRRE
jgi:hypothetical protein